MLAASLGNEHLSLYLRCQLRGVGGDFSATFCESTFACASPSVMLFGWYVLVGLTSLAGKWFVAPYVDPSASESPTLYYSSEGRLGLWW